MGFWKSLGTFVRQAGQALDGFGARVQGKYAYRETVPLHQTIQPFSAAKPRLAPDVFVAPNASVIGDVTLGKGSSVWYGAILRGDVNPITIGEHSNIQDGVVIHVAKENPKNQSAPTTIGSYVTIGHGATIHAATVEDGSLIGMGAILLDGSKVESGAIVAAGTVVPPGKTVRTGEVMAGNPARLLRPLEEGEAGFIVQAATDYAALAAVHAAENAKTLEELEVDKEKLEDLRERDPDYDSHLGLQRDPVTREVIHTAPST